MGERIIDGTAAPTRDPDTAATATGSAGTANAGATRNAGAHASAAGNARSSPGHRRAGAGHDTLAYANVSDRLTVRITNGGCARCSP